MTGVAIARHLVAASWLTLIAYWAIAARNVKRPATRQPWAGRLAYMAPAGLGVLLLEGYFGMGLDRRWVPNSAPVAWSALGISTLGLAGALWARRTLGANWSASVRLRAGHELVRRGPYRFVRNPIYSSILLMLLGPVLLQGQLSGALALVAMAAGFWIKLRQEERLMALRFPAEFAEYKRQVPALIPFLL